jgi:hypothetical protein
LIPVICAECGENFEIGDEFAGLTEYCPVCGALNDIPDPEAPALEVEAPQEQPPTELFSALLLPESSPRHGISTRLWWTILIAGLGLFVLTCIYLFSNNWEDRNIQALSDATNRGDVLMANEDYAGAAQQYRFVLDTVGHRSIDSAFILRLIDRARHGVAEADNRLRSPPAPAPQTQPAAAAATRPDLQFHLALKSFQSDYEAFPVFVRNHPVLFLDNKGNWRRRQYFVWQLTYDPPSQSEAAEILLHYDCGSYITEPHHDRGAASLDDHFADDESPKIVHCQTRFVLESGRWIILHHDADPETDAIPSVNIRPSLDDFYPIERLAFRSPQAGP